ncbi:DUF742 domain-containing protein [Yinghuangia seranimata]|uniref:DUF742 domain-containing protein n=1 Tax=Yinghuangia seranimata TaxID=408067 RepID=UPI00248AE7FE|nr:DUF742 domain-containing protein [Yinghuangia seranimata]MDI2128226.1 DUF742 domain-containing protein [Yinghuangia seranimata]
MVADDGGRGSASRSARVRPYALTQGRTAPGHILFVETLVTTLDCEQGEESALDAGRRDMPEVRAIIVLCRGVRSVAEVSALLNLPLGVVRVLISDLAAQGRISVYQTAGDTGRPDRALLERLLGGLRRL